MLSLKSNQAEQGKRVPHRIPILVKLLLLVTSCTIIPLAGSAVLSIRQGNRAVEAAARQHLELAARITATRLDQLFTDTSRMQQAQATRDTIMQFCQADAAGRKAIAPRLQTRMAEVLATDPDLCMMFIADRDGICLISTTPGMVGDDYRKIREYMQQALLGRQYISDLAVGTTTGEAGVFFSGPVRAADGTIVGAVVLKLKGTVIDDICSEVSRRIPRGFAAVIDSHEVFISHPDTRMLYRSVGLLPAGTLTGVNPKLQYGVESVESARLDDVLKELLREQPEGNVVFPDENGNWCIAGYARMRQRHWKVTVVQPRSEFDQPLRNLAWQQAGIIAGVGIIGVLAAVMAAYRFIRPIRSLTAAGRRAAQGDWSARAEISTHDELADLAVTFNEMMPQLRERAAMESSLRLAKEIQQHLLPQKSPTLAGLDVAGVNLPADQTGGDYYDFLDLSAWRAETLAVAVGDVTGHGIPAALLMATARALLRSRATPPGPLEELMADVNHRLCEDSPSGRFMTLLYALIDRKNRRVSLVSAGHDPIILFNPAAGEFQELAGDDIPLGIVPDRAFTSATFDHLPDGAVLVIGTDGIWETREAQTGEMFGKERLKDVVRTHGRQTAREIIDAILAELARFRGEARQEDDVTAVIVRFTPYPPAASGV
ncbi:MAG: SpoIIE family protein phosphatase [Phycisphaerae bacterium]